jgi:putative hydrolase of the HAD superfamily
MTIDDVRKNLWSGVRHVLLDMDGTLLDKYFDDFFWNHLVPEKYAEVHAMTFGRAREHLRTKYKSQEGTLNWTDIDYWSGELNIDIPALKEQILHLVEVHPHVEEFLKELQTRGIHVALATNAHYKTIAIKLRETTIGKYFDTVMPSFDMGFPKEDQRYWQNAQKLLGFDNEKTLFIDDTEDVLDSAALFGIKFVLLKHGANSKDTHEMKINAKKAARHLAFEDFGQLLPEKPLNNTER